MLDRSEIYTTQVKGVTVGALTRQQVIDAIECPACHEPIGSPCRGIDMVENKSHSKRRHAALELYDLKLPENVLADNRIDAWYRRFREHFNPELRARSQARRRVLRAGPLTVRYECPACGGPHPRAECRMLREVRARRRKERANV
jgi:hypothetical protein